MKRIRVRIALAIAAVAAMTIYAQPEPDETSYTMGYMSMKELISWSDSVGNPLSTPDGPMEFLAGLESVPAEFEGVDSVARGMYAYGMMLSSGMDLKRAGLTPERAKAFYNGLLSGLDSVLAGRVTDAGRQEAMRLLDDNNRLAGYETMPADSLNLIGRCFAFAATDPYELGFLDGNKTELTEASRRMFVMGMRAGVLMMLGEENIPPKEMGRIAGYAMLCQNDLLRTNGQSEVNYADMISGARAALGLESLRMPRTVIDSIWDQRYNYVADSVEVVEEVVELEDADSVSAVDTVWVD